MRRRLAATGAAVIACLTFATTACTQGSGTADPATPTKTATQILGDAAAKTKGQSFKYTIKYGEQFSGDGAQDAAGTSATRNITYTDAATGLVLKGQVLRVGESVYFKADFGPLIALIPGLSGVGNRWMIVDMKKVAVSGLGAFLVPGGDSVTPDAYVAGVETAEVVNATEIKGTIDLGKAAPKLLPSTELAKLGPDAKKVPFTATLDDQGRFIKIVVAMPAMGTLAAANLSTTYSDYGTATTTPAPAAADTVAAPELIYQFLK